jgi:hypothetical protein
MHGWEGSVTAPELVPSLILPASVQITKLTCDESRQVDDQFLCLLAGTYNCERQTDSDYRPEPRK